MACVLVAATVSPAQTVSVACPPPVMGVGVGRVADAAPALAVATAVEMFLRSLGKTRPSGARAVVHAAAPLARIAATA